jgi:signal transduction histidine kinase/PAS domain-containing protein
MNQVFNTFLLEHSPHLLVENGVVVGVGKKLLEYLDYTSEEIIGMNEFEVLDMFSGKDNSILSGTEKTPYLLFAKNGEAVFFDIHFSEHVCSHRRLYLFEKKDCLHGKQDLSIVHQLISNSPFGMAVFSVPDIVLLNANQSWLDRLDKPFNQKEESLGKHISEIMTGWKGSVFENIWSKVLSSGKACHMPEYRYSGLKKGVSFWNMSLTPIYGEGKLTHIVEITYDVTETVMNRNKIKMQKDQLFKQFQQFETVVENMSDALFIIYPDYKAVSLNQEAHAIKYLFNNFQYKDDLPNDITYYDSQDNVIPFQELPVFKLMMGEQLKALRATVKTPENTHHFSISGRPVYDDHKNIYFSIVCIRDVTTQVNQDNYILKVEKEKKEYLERVIAIKDDFLTLVSHEFKTPLTVIGTAIQALELFCGNELSEKARRYIAIIKQNSLRQLRLVSNLLDITRGTVDQIRLYKRTIDFVSLTRLITDSVKIYAAQKNLQISFDTNIESMLLCIDDEKYERILLNILSNAIKFTPKGKNIQVKLFYDDDYVNVSVRDEGVGIPKDKINVIFERFGQVDNSLSRQAEGSGIGLYLVKMFVEKMGGTISVKSVPYEGATFIIRFPVLSAEPSIREKECNEVDNKRIITMMNIEFSDIYLSKT